jgi:MFS family permease
MAFVVLTIAGAGFGGTYSISVSMGQQLLPHRTNLASGLLMGGAWGVAFLGPPLAQWILDQSNLRIAFVSSGVLLLVSGALIAFLPRQTGR